MLDKTVTIEDLIASEEYDYQLLEALTQGDIWILDDLTDGQKNDRHFMLPILYSVKNDLDTYEVYRYCGEDIQSDEELTLEVIKEEPHWIEGTPLSRNPRFIKDNLAMQPELIQYVSPEVKVEVIENNISAERVSVMNYGINNTFSQEILEIVNTLRDTPELTKDSAYMENAIIMEASLLNFASQELKNNSEFMLKVATNNPKVIEHVVKDVTNFSLESVSVVRKVSKDFTTDEGLAIIEEKAQTSEDIRYKKVQEKVDDIGKEHPLTIKFLTAMLAQNDTLDPAKVKDILNYSILTMEKLKKEREKTGQLEVTRDNLSQLITPLILKKLMKKIENQGVELDSDLTARIEEYIAFYNEYKAEYDKTKPKVHSRKSQAEIEEGEVAKEADSSSEVDAAHLITPAAIIDATIEAGTTTTEINEVVRDAKVRQQHMQPNDRISEEHNK